MYKENLEFPTNFISYKYIDENYTLKSDIILTSDGNYIMATFTGIGIVTIDASDIENMKII